MKQRRSVLKIMSDQKYIKCELEKRKKNVKEKEEKIKFMPI